MKNARSRNIALVTLIISVIIGGAAAVFTKIAVKEIPVFSVSFLRFFIAFVLLMPFVLKEKPKFNKKMYPLLLISLLATLNLILFCIGIQYTSALSSSTLYVCVPLLVAFFAYVLFHEKLNIQKIIGIITGFFGVFIILLLPLLETGKTIQGSLLGNILIFVGIISYALYTLLSKKLHLHFSASTITACFALTTVVVSFPFALHESLQHQWWTDVSPNGYFALIFISVFNSFIAYLLYQYTIKHGSPLVASMQFYLLPVSTFLWASVILGEKVTLGFLLGAVITFAGVFITLRQNVDSKTLR